ncbi:DUF1254 domain-containing protein [Flavobacterium hauense]
MKKIFLLSLLVLMASCKKEKTEETTTVVASSGSEVAQTAKEAFAFGLPLVLMDVTRIKMTNGNNPAASAPNAFTHLSYFPDATFRDVVRANADTYYSQATLDLKKEPMVLSVPNTHGRYYMMPILDAYTNVFTSPGTRTTGNEAHNFLVTGPNWKGEVPAGMEQLKSPTDMAWIIGRTQVNSKADGDKVVIPLQKQYKLTPLSAWGKPYTPPAATPNPDASKEDPNAIVKAMSAEEFFNYVNKLMADNPPTAADAPAMKKFAKIGVGPGLKFSLASFTPEEQEAIKKVPEEIFAAMDQESKKGASLVNGWKLMPDNVADYGTDYQTRAFIAYYGLGANLREDAIYPACSYDADGNQLNGSNNYVLHFDKGKTPPAKAFWSLTMYDMEGYMVANPINRNAIGDRSNLKTNADGSVDIYFQNASPGKDKEANWLPAPKGEFNILLRVYWPKEEMLNGSWKAPAVKKVG